MRYKYLFLFLIILICVCGYLFITFYEGAKDSAIDDLNARQRLHAQYAAKEIESFFSRWTYRLTYLAKHKTIVTLDDRGKREMEFFYAAHKDDIKGITRVDAQGNIAYTVPYVKASIGVNIAHQKHIKEIMSTHKPVVSDVFSAIQGYDTVAFHVPVFRHGKYDGCIGILIDFKALSKRYLEHIRIGTTGYAWMTSQSGIELYCPVPGHVGKSVFENCKDFPTIIDMAKEMVKGNRGIMTYYFDMIMGRSVHKMKKHAIYMPIKVGNTFWSIVIASSEDEILASLRDFRNRLIVLIAVLILSATFFSYYGMKAWGVLEEEKKRKMAERVLRESERRLSDIINFLPDAIMAIDREGRIIVWNKAIEEMTGYPAERMLGKGNHEYAIPFYGARRPILFNFVSVWDPDTEKKYSFIKKEGDTLYTETDVPCVRGRNRILWGKAGPLYDIQGNIVGAIESIRDVTERRQAELALRESENLLRAIFNSTFQFTGVVAPDGILMEINQTALDFARITKEDVIGKYFWETPWWQSNKANVQRLKDAVSRAAEGKFVRYEVEMQGAGHITAIADFSLKPIFDPDGRVTMLIPEGRDVTERKRAEEALFNEKEKLQVLSENAPFGMALIDRNGHFLYVNPKFREIFGYELGDVPNGKTWFRKGFPDPAMRSTVIRTWMNDIAASNGKLWQRVFSVTCKDGSVKTINFTPVLLKDMDTILVCEDITERKKLEAQLLDAQKMEAIGTLSGGIAHDFNNILMGIQGYASLIMLDIGPGNPQYDRLKRIEEQVKSAADLTGQLLGFARGGKYVTKPINMNDLIEKTSTMFGRTKKEIAIHSKYEKDIWAVEADQGQIEQVLLNLYLNAWQAMPQGGEILLETRNAIINDSCAGVYSMVPGRYVRVSISDTGMGMDEKTRERIFEPFFTTKELGRGTGLGLAMVYGIVKNHNGFIEVASEPGKGTTFTLYFPASEKVITEERPETPGVVKGTGTILVVDDEPQVLAVSKEILECLGYVVHGAKSGEEALALYKEMKGSVSLVIIDMIMPGLSGSETFDRLRELDPSAKIMLASGYSLDGQAREIMNKGCDGFIQKPFDITLISQKVRELLEK